AFPSFGERDVAKPARMPKEGAVLGVMHGRKVLCAIRFGKLFGCRFTAMECAARVMGRLSFGKERGRVRTHRGDQPAPFRNPSPQSSPIGGERRTRPAKFEPYQSLSTLRSCTLCFLRCLLLNEV